MLRSLFIQVALFFLPFALYGLLLLWKRRKGIDVEKHPFVWLSVAGFVLVAFGLAVMGYMDRSPPGSAYTPPYMENGRIVPGQFR